MILSRTRLLLSATMAFSLVGASHIVTPASASIDSTLADRQVGEIQQLVQQFPTAFGGVWADPATGVVSVNLISSAQSSAAGMQALARLRSIGTGADPAILSPRKHWAVRVNADLGPSYASLKSVFNRVKELVPTAVRLGSNISYWSIDSRQRVVVIGATVVTADLRAAAKGMFGGLAKVVTSDMPLPTDRWIDSQPYYGGDHINVAGGNVTGCSTSFEMSDPSASNHTGVLTAGHCFNLGAVVAQGYNSGGHLYSSGNIGKVTHKSYADYAPDTEFLDSTAVGASVSTFIWLGTNPPSGVAKVSGAGTSFQGLTVCADGAYTGENCNGVVSGSETCVNIGHYDCWLWPVTSTNGSRLSSYGDSGGPVFYPDGSGGLTAYGTMTAANSAGTNMWYTDINEIANWLGVNLVH